jgi:hypothetical protein
LTPATLPGVNGRPILASAEFSDIDNPLSGDQLGDIGIAHTIAAPINTPMCLSFSWRLPVRAAKEFVATGTIAKRRRSAETLLTAGPITESAGPDEPTMNAIDILFNLDHPGRSPDRGA